MLIMDTFTKNNVTVAKFNNLNVHSMFITCFIALQLEVHIFYMYICIIIESILAFDHITALVFPPLSPIR